jgi:IMP dehydrogenase
MQEANVGCLVVVREGLVQGILTDRDIAVRCTSGGHDPQQCMVAVHMSSPVVVVRPNTDLLEAAHLMLQRRVKRLPVVEDGRLVGLVSLSDVAKAMDTPLHELLIGMGAGRRAA